MPHSIALKLQSHSALAAVVRTGGSAIVVEAAVRIPLPDGATAKAIGSTIAQALAPLHTGRARAVVIIPRADLSWQNYDLPPVPADDLPDLVHLQAQRDLPLADDGEGFDFLPLSGDEQHPYRVLGVGMLPDELERIRGICDAADLKLDHIVPEPLGWPELGRRIAAQAGEPESLVVFAAMAGRQAIVWASEGDALRLVRTIWLPEEPSIDEDAAALSGELRRTLLSLAQSHHADRSAARCVYCGTNAEAVAGQLGALLSKPVLAVPLETLVEVPDATGGTTPSRIELAPLAAIAAALAERRAPLVDLLHPRRRPVPASRMRTYVLAAIAAAALAGALAWQGYAKLQAPLAAAAEADAQRAALEPMLESLAADQESAAAIGAWVDGSPNLLVEVDALAERLRPEPLDSDAFKADEDFVLTKLMLANHEFTLTASAKSNAALQPAEGRLRAGDYRVDRGVVDWNSTAVPGYGVSVQEVVERIELPAAEGEPAP